MKFLPVIPTSFDVVLCVFTVAMYTIFFTRQFPSNGHLLFTLQLQVTSMLFSFVFNDLSIAGFNYLSYVFVCICSSI